MKIVLRARASVFALSLISLALPLPVFSQAKTVELDPLVVSAARMPQSLSEASVIVDVISRQEIEQSGVSSITEFFDSVNGMTVSRLYGRAGIDASVDIGYMGESGSQNVLLLIDGQRINSIDSAKSRFAQLPLSSIEQVEIRKANGGVLFGDRAQGGVINIITRKDALKVAELSYGSFGYKKQDVFIGFKNSGVRGSISFMNVENDGYRVHSESNQHSAQLRLAANIGSGLATFFVREFEEEAKLPSTLTKTQFDANPQQIGAFPALSKRTGFSSGFRFEQSMEGGNTASVDIFHQTSKDVSGRSIKNSRSAITPEYKITIFGNPLIFGGEFVKADANTARGMQVSQNTQAVFSQLTHSITNRTNFDFGIRTQKAESKFSSKKDAPVTFSVAQKTAATAGLLTQLSSFSTIRAGILSGFRFPNADELSKFNRSDFTLLEINPTVKPMSTREYFVQYEQRHQSGKFAVHYRHIDTTDEIGFQRECGIVGITPASCNSNLYDTRRSIVTLSTEMKIGPMATLRGSVDFVNATIASESNVGNRIPLTPKQVIRIAYDKKISNYVLSASAHYRSDMFQAGDQSATLAPIPQRTYVDLGVKTQFSNTVSGSLWVRNAFNKSYYDYASFDGIYPADGRAFFLSLNLGF